MPNVGSTIRIVLRMGEGFDLSEFNASAVTLCPLHYYQITSVFVRLFITEFRVRQYLSVIEGNTRSCGSQTRVWCAPSKREVI